MKIVFAFAVMALALISGCTYTDGPHLDALDWLESLDGETVVAEVTCHGEVEVPPGSGLWRKRETSIKVTAAEMVEVARAAPPGSSWASILNLARTSGGVLLKWMDKILAALVESNPTIDPDKVKFKEWYPEEQCKSRALRNPPVTPMGYCPLGTDTCPDNPDTPEPTEPGPSEPGPYGAISAQSEARRS